MIGAGEKLAGVGADIDATGVFGVGRHAVPQDAQLHVGAFWKSISERFPVFASVLSAIDCELLAKVVAPVGFYDGEEGVGVVYVYGYRKAEFGGQIVLDVYPIVTSVGTLIDAAVVLLVEDVGLRGML